MTTLADRPNAALLVIDMQVAVVSTAHDRAGVIANIQGVVAKARAAQVPVIWVRHADEGLVKDSPGWAIVPDLVPLDDEVVVDKAYRDAFEATDLEDRLAEAGIGRLYITGAQTDFCIRSTLNGGLVRGYDTILIGDAHTTEDLTKWGAPPPGQVIAHTNFYWRGQTAPGREAGVVSSASSFWLKPHERGWLR